MLSIKEESKQLQEFQTETMNQFQGETPVTSLTSSESSEVDIAFSGVKNFRELGEKITNPIESILLKTTDVIEKDPIMNVSRELSDLNSKVSSIYGELINDDSFITTFLKKIPGIGSVAKYIDQKYDEVRFNMKSINEKLEAIFKGFDTSYDSVTVSIKLQKQFLDDLNINLGKVIAYKDYIELKMEEFRLKKDESSSPEEIEKYNMFIRNVDLLVRNLVVLISNLELSRRRLLVRLDSATKLAITMNGSRPIFKTLFSSAILEMSSQKAIDASILSIESMGKTIDTMSGKLTDKVIETNKKTEELSAKPILDTKIFIQNVEKLHNHFETIEEFRKSISDQAIVDTQKLEDSLTKLKRINEYKKEDFEALEEELKA